MYTLHRHRHTSARLNSVAGKSTFAESLFENPFLITVEDAEHLDLKGFDVQKHDGVVLDNVSSWAQLLSWRAVLQGRNAKSRGGQSATNMYSYIQYLFGVPVVATVDLDAPDPWLVERGGQWASRWLLKNTVLLRLQNGETFYVPGPEQSRKVPNSFSLFAQTVKRRRMAAAGEDAQPRLD